MTETTTDSGGEKDGAALPFAPPVVRLAKCLYEEMEHLDPPSGPEAVEWSDLPSRTRVFYCLCVARLFRERVDCAALIEDADHNSVFR